MCVADETVQIGGADARIHHERTHPVQSASFGTGVKEIVTLLVKSRCSISNVMGVSVTKEMYPLSLAFKRCMHDRFCARF
jgi:hypothetical protein